MARAQTLAQKVYQKFWERNATDHNDTPQRPATQNGAA